MNKEILENYFTDAQISVILGITLGGLRNKIYRKKTDDIPPFLEVSSRARVWSKEKVKIFLLGQYDGDEDTVNKLLAKGEAAKQ